MIYIYIRKMREMREKEREYVELVVGERFLRKLLMIKDKIEFLQNQISSLSINRFMRIIALVILIFHLLLLLYAPRLSTCNGINDYIEFVAYNSYQTYRKPIRSGSNYQMSSSPCAACKFLRRKCTHECVFAPYFPPDNPQKFANVHRVFGASNVSKLLSELHTSQREEAVNSLSYEAEYRLRDPVYGCVGVISLLQHRLTKIQYELAMAKGELAGFMGSPAIMSNEIQQHSNNNLSHSNSVFPISHMSHHHQMIGMQPAVAHDGQLMVRSEPYQNHHQQQFYQSATQQQIMELQQMATMGSDKLEIMRKSQQQQQQQQQANYELAMFSSNNNNGGSDVDLSKVQQIHMNDHHQSGLLDHHHLANSHHDNSVYHQYQHQPELFIQQSAVPDQHQQQHHHAPKLELKTTSEEEGLSADPFC